MTALFLLYLRIKSSYMKKLFFTLFIILSFCNLGFTQNTIDPRLQEILSQKSDEMIPINIVFKSQIDITKLNTRASVSLDKKVRRSILVDEFKLFSEQQQEDVLSILKSETRSYKVTNIKSHWLTNAISCNADRNVIYLLSEHPDIMLIGYNEMTQMAFTEECQQTTDDVQQSAYKSRNDDDDLYLTDNILMVNADKVWKLGYTGKGVIVAVIDSGVNYNHTDLADHLWDGGAQYPNHGYNTIDDNFDTMDRYSHGTHCAGTVCGDGTSGIYTGIAPDATLMCVKALNDQGKGNASSIIAAMEFAIENQADILNMSLGIVGPSVTDKTLLRRSCVNALEHGVIASVATGNYRTDSYYQVPNNILAPADCPPPWLHPDQQSNSGALSCVVAVGATDYFENIYEGSSKGPVTWTDTEYNDYPYGGSNIGLIRPDVCAPGVGIKSLDYAENNGYYLKTGTSMAAPCVAGVMALMLEKQPDLTPAEICETLEKTAKKLSNTKSNDFGSGLVDALKAVNSCINEDDEDDEPENPEEKPVITYTISAIANPENAGNISGEGSYDENTTVTLTATPNEGYNFLNWTENGNLISTEVQYSFTITSDRNLVANFEIIEEEPEQPVITYSINVIINPENAGTVIGTGSYTENDTVTLIATANEGYKFVKWTENNMIISRNAEYSFAITDNRELVANFVSTESIDELRSSLHLYPNPVNDKLIIVTEVEIEEIVVYTITGVIAGQQSTINNQQSLSIDLSNLNSGVYFVMIKTNEGVVTKRFVKK